MRSRVRFVVLAAVVALLAAACGSTTTSDVAATVNDEEIPLAVMERIVAAKTDGLGLEGRELRRVSDAVEAGLIDRAALSSAIQQALPSPEPELPEEAADQAFDLYTQAVGEQTITEAREELGLSQDEWREVYDIAVDAEYQALLAGISPQVPYDREDMVLAAQRDVLTLLIQVTVIDQVFEERGLELEEGAVEDAFAAELERVRDEDDTDDEAEEKLAEQLGGTGLGVEDYREIVLTTVARRDAVISSFVDLTDEEIEQAYEEGLESGRFVTAEVSHILLSPEMAEGESEPSDPALAVAEAEAQRVLSQLEEGADFAELAEEFSDDPGSAQNGGTLPEAPLGNYVPEFRDAALTAPIGEIIGPVQSQFGFHIIRVESRSELSLEEAEQQIRADAEGGAGQEASAAIQEAFANAEVEVPERFGVWDEASTRVVSEDPLDSGTGGTGGAGGTGGNAPGGG